MSDGRIERIVNAVLYEGYMLYPYRASSVKNRQRWNFGVIVPDEYHRLVDPSERNVLRTECLVEGTARTSVEICVRFLQLVRRDVSGDVGEQDGDALDACDETVEREVAVTLSPSAMHEPYVHAFDLAAARATTDGVTRTSEAVCGEIRVEVLRSDGDAMTIAISIANRTPFDTATLASRDEALRRSLLSAHAVLTAHDGAFVSLLDPGDTFRDAAASCRQDGLYPVLAGEEGDRRTVLAAPIILYDHPQVAPESPSNLFDGTEIDEILTLRIQTLSEDEKREIRSGDPRTRQLLQRADDLQPELLGRLHGALRRTPPSGDSQ